eukprot:242274-Alexandrium_andersonii.AAC.1
MCVASRRTGDPAACPLPTRNSAQPNAFRRSLARARSALAQEIEMVVVTAPTHLPGSGAAVNSGA